MVPGLALTRIESLSGALCLYIFGISAIAFAFQAAVGIGLLKLCLLPSTSLRVPVMFDGLSNNERECDSASSGQSSVQSSLCAGDSTVTSRLFHGPRMLDFLPEDVIIRILEMADTPSTFTCQMVRLLFTSHSLSAHGDYLCPNRVSALPSGLPVLS